MVAAVLPDIDGIGILVDVEYYKMYHHVLGHTIFFGLLSAVGFAIFSGGKPVGQRLSYLFGIYLLMFNLHVLLDYLGSGPGWGMKYFWPLSDYHLENPYVWQLQSWQTTLSFFVLLIWMMIIAYGQKRTPLEMIAPNTDRKIVEKFSQFVEK